MATKVITKKTLAEDLAAKFGWTKKDATEAVNYVFDEITDAVVKGGEASINGFGKFERVSKKARTGLNPATGEKITIKASKAPKFKASKTFKDAVNK
jgi:DNA-binding protein HU-beta